MLEGINQSSALDLMNPMNQQPNQFMTPVQQPPQQILRNSFQGGNVMQGGSMHNS
jgi:hypothetical protein